MEKKYSKTILEIDKLSLVTSVVALGYVVAQFLETQSRMVKLILFGSPLHFWVDSQTIMILVVTASVISGTASDLLYTLSISISWVMLSRSGTHGMP